MKLKFSLLLLLIINFGITVKAAPGRGILAGEYFWDTDPGQGNATAISASNAAFGNEVTFIVQNGIGLPSPVGIHTFNIRIKDASGNWGPLFTTAFDLEASGTTTRYVKAGEYFWDTDPGQGNGQPMIALSGSFTTAYQLLGQSNMTLPAVGAHTFNIRSQDAAGNWGPVFSVVVDVQSSTVSSFRKDSIAAAEYFWDTDPGLGSGNPMLTIGGTSTNTEVFEYLTQSGVSLPSGIGAHTLNIRSKDVAGHWGPVFTVVVAVQTPVSSLREDSVEAAEYFWDTDPGQGSGNPMLLSLGGAFTAAMQGISKSGIALPSGVGAHTLNIRSKDVAGNWGAVFTVVVDVQTPVSSLREDSVEAAEYFWDTDPGQGSGNPMLLSRGGSLTAAVQGISKSGVALPSGVGPHTLNTRSKDVAGNWGSVFTVIVDVQTPVSSLREDSVAAAEYFWDADPGQGSASPMLLSRGGSLTAAVQGISQSAISLPSGTGAHTLNIRSKDVAGNWGPVFTVVEDVQAPVSSLRKDSVIAGEYFFDTDPGLGNGTPLALAKGAPTTPTGDIRLLVGGNLPAVSQGLHVLYFRARDIAGNWGPSFGMVDSIGTTNCYNLAFTGNGTVCGDRLAGNTYSVPLYNGNIYTWGVTGGTIASGTGTNSIVVNWNASGPYKLSVTECTSGGLSCCSDSMIPVLLTTATSSVSISICQGQSYAGHGATGNYVDTLSGAAANGCDSIRTLHLTVTSPPTATVTGATPACVGANVTLSTVVSGDTGTITYQWQSSTNGTNGWTNIGTNSSTYAPVTSSAGILYYQCLVTYVSPGCNTATSNTVSEVISPQPSVAISGGNISVCEGASINLSAMPTGGAGTTTYQWQSSPNGTTGWVDVGGNADTYSPATSSVGTNYYQVVVSSSGAGCVNATSNNQDIIVGAQPTASISGGNDTICKGGSSILAATSTGTGTVSYQWQSSSNGTNWIPVGANTATYSAPTSSAGTTHYEVVVSYTGTGCNNATSGSEIVTVVIPPSATISGGNDTVCANSTNNLIAVVSGGAGTPVYQWQSSANGTTGWANVGPDSSSYASSTLTPGTLYYRIVATFAGSGCSSDTSNIQAVTVNGRSDTSSFSITHCEGTPYFFGTRNIYQAGTYFDTLTAVSGCDSIVTLYFNVVPASTTSVSDTICRGNSYNFYGTQITSSGNYSDTLMGSTGCDSIIALTMYVPTQPVITLTGSDTLSTGVYPSYQWLLNDTAIQGAISRQYIAVRNGTYKVAVMATSNCEDTSEPVVVKTVGINNIADDERVSLFPNPTTGELKINIEGLSSGPIVIRLFDLYGQRVFADRYAISSGNYNTVMHLDELPAGVYFISILSGQNTYSRKVEVVR